MSIPKVLFLVDYEYIFGDSPPKNRLSLLKNITRRSVLYELAALNYRLKPKNKFSYDKSFETQLKELKYFTNISYELFLFYEKKLKEAYSLNGAVSIFTRQNSTYGLEEIVNSDELKDIDDFSMAKKEVWDSIIKYLLAINTEITEIKKENEDAAISIEKLNPKLLVLNELGIENNPIFEAYRGYRFLSFLDQSKLRDALNSYTLKVYKLKPTDLCYQILSLYISNNNDQYPDLEFCYRINEKDKNIFSKLSEHCPNEEITKLLRIRKSPFIKDSDKVYILSDNNFLIEKVFTQLINDFWFDYLKPNKIINIKEYRGLIGQFIEMYLSEIIRNSFSQNPHFRLWLFDELKIKVGKNEIEVADLCLRYNRKILVAQVKSTSIYDKEKYGGDVMSLYKGDRDKFFKNFGINQLVSSIENLENYYEYFDPGYPNSHPRKIYPCIIVSDKSLQTPLMAQVFNERFSELIKDMDNKKLSIHPLTLMHISDIERLESLLYDSPSSIWPLLEYNFRDSSFIPPFYNTINRKVLPKNFFSQRIDELYKLIKENRE